MFYGRQELRLASQEKRSNMKLNKEWHEKNRMPKNPTLEQRMKWHLEHSNHCACRPIPGKLLVEIKKRHRNKKRP